MLKKLIPVLLALIGTGAGVGAGMFLMPADDPPSKEAVEKDGGEDKKPDEKSEDFDGQTNEYVKLNNQFVIPIMGKERVEALVVASLSVEVINGSTQLVYQKEPKLRDVFLQVMFDHANIGGFQGSFTSGERMDILRSALLDAARSVLGDDVKDVLITEIARQDAA